MTTSSSLSFGALVIMVFSSILISVVSGAVEARITCSVTALQFYAPQ